MLQVQRQAQRVGVALYVLLALLGLKLWQTCVVFTRPRQWLTWQLFFCCLPCFLPPSRCDIDVSMRVALGVNLGVNLQFQGSNVTGVAKLWYDNDTRIRSECPFGSKWSFAGRSSCHSVKNHLGSHPFLHHPNSQVAAWLFGRVSWIPKWNLTEWYIVYSWVLSRYSQHILTHAFKCSYHSSGTAQVLITVVDITRNEPKEFDRPIISTCKL
jgi:hypothetical protein